MTCRIFPGWWVMPAFLLSVLFWVALIGWIAG